MAALDEILRSRAPYRASPISHPEILQSVPVNLNPHNRVHPGDGPINKHLWGGFLEHLGRCIYGGIVDDPKNPSPKELLIPQDDGSERTKGRAGWRKDVKECISHDGDLEVPMLRWPGGNYVQNYHWQDGIGLISQRPKRIELAWHSSESNQFGTDEFMDYCKATGCEPYICLNSTLEEALAWVEYCNGTGDTHWANLRRKNTGRDAPHKVTYWGLGNEVWGPWQVGKMSPTDYAKMAKTWAHALKLVDPTIKLVSCGRSGSSEWDREVLTTMVNCADLHSIHYYSNLGHQQTGPSGNEYEKNVFGPAAAEKSIEVCRSLIELAQIERSDYGIPPQDMKIAFDEWNVWDEMKANSTNGLEQWYDYTDMLAFCAWLNLLARQSKHVTVGCLAQSVNVIAPMITSPTGICKQAIYYPLRLFSKYMKDGYLIQTPAMPDRYTGLTHPAWVDQLSLRPAYIDVVAMHHEETGSIRMSVLNRHPKQDWTLKTSFGNFDFDTVEIHEMYSDDLSAKNTFEKPETIVPRVTKVKQSDWKGEMTIKKHSWVFLMFNSKSQ